MKTLEIIILSCIAITIFVLLTTNSIEYFTSSMQRDYLQDYQNLCAWVSPYVTGVYEYLRIKYYYPEDGNAPIVYKPTQGDITLADPLLPSIRSQLKAYIDSATFKMNQKYGSQMPLFQESNSLTYQDNQDHTLTLNFVAQEKLQTYLV